MGLRNKTLTGVYIIVLVVFFMGIMNTTASVDKAEENDGSSTADHSKFEELAAPFKTGPEVTKACLECHNEAATQVQHTFHWTWEPVDQEIQGLGKARYLNNL